MLDHGSLADELALGRDRNACLGRCDQTVAHVGLRYRLSVGPSCARLIEAAVRWPGPQQPDAT
jgi:hypothetical protein